jgi:hypothetical protein
MSDDENADQKKRKVGRVPHYLCLQTSVAVEPKKNEILLTVRRAVQRN